MAKRRTTAKQKAHQHKFGACSRKCSAKHGVKGKGKRKACMKSCM